MQCPYGCNTEIEKIELKTRPSRTLKEGESVNDNTGPGRIIELYYEKNSDGDLEYIHICKEFQKILDYQMKRTGVDIIRNKIFEKNYDADFNATELDPQIINEIFGSSIKQDEIDAILTDYEKIKKLIEQIQTYDLKNPWSGLLEYKLIKSIECIKCHNVYSPIIELGNLYLSEAKFYPANQIFNEVLRWNRYEPISNIGKAEILLHTESDLKTAGTLLLDCKSVLGEMDSMLTLFGYVGYDDAFVISKINYLLAIIDIRWNRYTSAKKRLEQSLLKLEKDWINFWFEEHELEKEISSKIIQKKFWDKTGLDSSFLIEPHPDLLRHVIDTHIELGKIPGFSDVAEKGESLQEKYSKLVTNQTMPEIIDEDELSREQDLIYAIGIVESSFSKSELDEASKDLLQQWDEEEEMLEKYENEQADEYFESIEDDPSYENYRQDELDDMSLEHEEQANFMPESEEDGGFIKERDFDYNDVPDNYESEYAPGEYEAAWEKEEEKMEANAAYEEAMEHTKKVVRHLKALGKTDKDIEEENYTEEEEKRAENAAEEEEYAEKYDRRIKERMKKLYGYTDEELESRKNTIEEYSNAMDQIDKEDYEAEQEKNRSNSRINPNISTWENTKNFLLNIFDIERSHDEIDKIWNIASANQPTLTPDEISKTPKAIGLPPLPKDDKKNKEIDDDSTKLSLVDYSTPKIQITKLSDDEMIASIEIAFRKLIRRKLLNEENWEQLIPYYTLKQAKERLEEANLKDFTTPGNDWLEYVEIMDFERIFCRHCKICKYQKRMKEHDHKYCKQSNWYLYIKTVFNNQINVLRGDLEAFRDIRNSVSHHSGKAIGKFITPEGRETLVSLYTKWNKFMCKDEDKSKLR